jgi:hypothetical protein
MEKTGKATKTSEKITSKQGKTRKVCTSRFTALSQKIPGLPGTAARFRTEKDCSTAVEEDKSNCVLPPGDSCQTFVNADLQCLCNSVATAIS